MSPQSGKTEDRRSPAVAGNEQPPRLETKLWQGIKLLLLLNILPICGLAYVGLAYYQGKVALKAGVTGKQLVAIGAVVAACAVIALSSWLIMPFARWLKAYPLWHFRKQSRIAWFLPMLGGQLGYLLCWLFGVAAMLGSVFVIVTGAAWIIKSMLTKSA